MPALFTCNSAAPTPAVSCRIVQAKELCADGTSPLCKVLVGGQVLSGVYEPVRRHLIIPCAPSSKLADQPQSVSALIYSCDSSLGAGDYLVLLAAEDGATLVLPRDGAESASEVRVLPRYSNGEATGSRGTVVAQARSSDPYKALLEAARALADHTGAQLEEVHAYVLPLLDGVNRLLYDAPLVAAKLVNKDTRMATALEQQLNEGFLVQAGPGCPAKSLLQAPGLRICKGMTAPLGLRYSGLSVVYGTATGNILAVMETAAALKMAPVGSMRALGSSSSVNRMSGDVDSPSAVSAGVSAATSATPSPRMSRSNSSNCDADVADAVASLAVSPPTTTAPFTPPLALSGRSITTAPIIQVLAAADVADFSGDTATTPTGATAQMLTSFALLGLKTAGGRLSAVQRCRIMPSSAAPAAVRLPDEGGAAAAEAGAGGLGLMVQVEVVCASACTLLLFLEGPEHDAGAEDSAPTVAAGPVRTVLLQGRKADWRYSRTAGILKVELPRSTAPLREVQVFI